MTVWNPIGVGFAIVTSAVPALDPARFLGLSLLCAAIVSAGSLVLRPRRGGGPERRRESQGGGRELLLVLAAVAGLIAATLILHRLLDVSFTVAACIVMPLLAAIWPRIEPALRGTGSPGPVAALGDATAAMANEATIFLAASVIGAGLTAWLGQAGWDALTGSGALPALVVILACLALVPLAGALLVPHSIVVVLAAQLFGTGPVGTGHPYALALGLCFAWAMAISASPISAMSIIAGRHLGVPPSRVTFAINRGFTIYGLLAAAALISLTYILE